MVNIPPKKRSSIVMLTQH